ncbi:MAG: prolipoprotein diacylglyceryl transferase [Lachnospiraceae bacterium]
MSEAIIFPHLGIELKHVGRAVSVFGFDIAYYGIIIALAILIGAVITVLIARYTGQNPEDYLDLAVFAVVFGIIGARLFYVAFSWDLYKDHPLSIFNIRQGGLAIYGGLIAAVITVFVFAWIKKLSAAEMLDTACVGLLVGQMLGRWGNFFNREAFGEYTDGLFAMMLPIDSVRVSDVTDRMRNHIEMIDGVRFIQVHPTFLYESFWCLLVLIAIFFCYSYRKFEGEMFLVYLFGYGIGRMWIEGLRTDQLTVTELELPVSQILSGLLAVAALILIVYNRQQDDKTRLRRMREKEARKNAKNARKMFHGR